MACCRRGNGFSPKVLAQLRAKMCEIENVFPGTERSILVSRSGDLITSSLKKDRLDEEAHVHPVLSLKKAAIQFSSTLHQFECPVVHVRGVNTIFSLYDVDDGALLAFHAEMHSTNVAAFNTAEADRRMVDILQDIRMLMQNLTA